MNLSLYIAKRYLLSKKSHNAINLISGISVIGVAVATMALVVTLSVFNGFHDMVHGFLTTLDPQLKVIPKMGKTMPSNSPVLDKIRDFEAVELTFDCVEDNALIVYNGNQIVVTLRGVDKNFQSISQIDSILYGDGEFKFWDEQLDLEAAKNGELQYKRLTCATLGIGVADRLGIGANFLGPLKVFAPEKEGQLDLINIADGFREDSLFSNGVVFNVKQTKYDRNYIIVPIDFTRKLFNQTDRISSLNIKIKPGYSLTSAKSQLESIAGDDLDILTQEEQQEDVYRIMKIEKLMAYIFLTFILLVACFNIIGSLSMLIIDKKDNVITLRSLGANDKLISQIFLIEGWMISTIGAVFGIIIGLLLCWLQKEYGLVALGKSSGTFVVDAYPVSIHATDILVIFATVIIVGYLSVMYPVRYLSKKLV